MPGLARYVGIVILVAGLSSLARAQIVRGRVTERGSGSAIPGVLVTLVDSRTHAQAAATLSDVKGDYAVRAPHPGAYRVEAKRIGVRRFVGASLTLGEGETRQLNITVEGIAFTLPEVIVSGVAACSGSSRDAPRIAALWEEVRAALAATTISQRDRMFRGSVTRYVRELDPTSHRVISEEGREVQGVVDRPFRAVHADSLSQLGYVQTGRDNLQTYYAPDADVLLSDAFVRDHCFRVAAPDRDRRALVGIAFAPAAGRVQTEVAGTMWLDARTFELRLVEFAYVNVRGLPDDNAIGGEVHFARLPNGAWIVRRWFIRLPSGARAGTPMTLSGGTPNVFARRVGYRLREEGGYVTAQSLLARERPAGLVGTVVDSLGNGLAGATVLLSGTPYRAVTDAAGRYRLGGVAAGTFAVVVEHPGYRAYGIFAAESEVNLPEGTLSELALTAPRTREIRRRICPGTPLEEDQADLRVNLVDASGRPATFTWVRVSWTDYLDARPAQIRTRPQSIDAETDRHGGVTVCGVPARALLPIAVLRGDEKRPVRADSVRLNAGEIRVLLVRTP